MIPVECLLPIDIMIKEDAGRSTICQLNWLLTACKEAFLNPSTTKCVIEYIKLIIKKVNTLWLDIIKQVIGFALFISTFSLHYKNLINQIYI